MSRRFIALGERDLGAWVEVARSTTGQIVIERDPEAPAVTLADVELPGRELSAEEFQELFGDLPTDPEG